MNFAKSVIAAMMLVFLAGCTASIESTPNESPSDDLSAKYEDSHDYISPERAAYSMLVVSVFDGSLGDVESSSREVVYWDGRKGNITDFAIPEIGLSLQMEDDMSLVSLMIDDLEIRSDEYLIHSNGRVRVVCMYNVDDCLRGKGPRYYAANGAENAAWLIEARGMLDKKMTDLFGPDWQTKAPEYEDPFSEIVQGKG